MINILYTSIELGLLYAPAILGVFFTFRILNFPDLTVESSFVTGAASAAIAIKNGVPGPLSLIIGFVSGFFAGCLTAFLHTKLKIGKILSGILSFSMLYTINLRLMNGPNVSLLNEKAVISLFESPLNNIAIIIFLLVVVFISKIFVDWFLQTEFGLFIRATGENELTAKSFSIDINTIKFVVIGLSNGFVGLSGSLITQFQGFADISIGVGTLVLILASLMLGETLIHSTRISINTLAIIIGSIAYQIIINIALYLGLAGSDLKFVTALIVVATLVLSSSDKKIFLHGK